SFDANRQWMSVDSRNSIFMGRDSIPAAYNVTENQLMNAYRNLIIVSDSFTPTYANKDWAEFRENVQTRMGNTTNLYWDKSARDYDLMRLLSVAGMDILNKGVDITDGENYWEYMLKRPIMSITGSPDYVDGLGMLAGSAQILYFSNSHNSLFNLWPEEIYHVDPINPKLRITTSYCGWSINWLAGIPLDTPSCGFNGEKCLKAKDRVLIIALCSGIVVIGALLVIATLLFRRYRYERRLHSLDFLIPRNQITLKRHVNILSQRSLRSMKSMASIGGSVMASQTMKNSHFIIEDLLGEGKGERKVNSVASIDEEGMERLWGELHDFSVGIFENQLIGLKKIYLKDIQLTRSVRREIIMLTGLNHENLIRFRGLIAESSSIFVVSELASRGSIKDILDNGFPLQNIFLNQISIDICTGLDYLHSNEIGCHGRLKSSNCLIDARWMVKLSSFGMREARKEEGKADEGIQEGRDDLWSAPEVLRQLGCLGESLPILVRKADIYSLGIILHEIFARNGPWG
ncbi:hypothetical protein PFISCL1PPCAC_6172, partial [Pristionchus fissidentatus]